MPPRPCSAPSGPPTVRRQPRVYWRPIVAVGAFTSLLVAGLVITLGLAVRPSRADRDIDNPGADAEAQFRAPISQSPSLPATVHGVTADKSTTVATPIARKSDLDRGASPAVIDHVPDDVAGRAVSESYGTAVEFLSRPAEAARQALKEHKLLFLLHVSGNFEEAKFT